MSTSGDNRGNRGPETSWLFIFGFIGAAMLTIRDIFIWIFGKELGSAIFTGIVIVFFVVLALVVIIGTIYRLGTDT